MRSADFKRELARSVASGKVQAPGLQPVREVPNVPDRSPFLFGRVPCVSTSQIHVFEDADVPRALDLGEVFALQTRAANDVIAQHGDVFDFFAFFVTVCPNWGAGAAFYLPIVNDIEGIGDPSGSGTPIFDGRASLGISSQRVQGYIMMHGIDSGFWAPGDDFLATTTRLVLAHEFGHRWNVFLPPLADGRAMQGDFATCGCTGHWNYRIDGQGSCLYLQEYVGANPTVRDSTFGAVIDFNRDTGGAYGFPELYLMGYVTPDQMDAGMSELRYLNDACLDDEYGGLLTDFSSADIIATAGARQPDAASAQKHFRTAWIMLHAPGQTPTDRQLDDMAGIMRQQMLDFNAFTLGLGTLDVTLFDECSSVQGYGCGVNPIGSLVLAAGEPRLRSALTFELDNPLGTQAPGAVALLAVSLAADPAFPCGTARPRWGMNGPGELLVSLATGDMLRPVRFGPPWMGTGSPAPIVIDVPGMAQLVGLEFHAQGALLDTGPGGALRIGLTSAIQFVLGP